MTSEAFIFLQLLDFLFLLGFQSIFSPAFSSFAGWVSAGLDYRRLLYILLMATCTAASDSTDCEYSY